MSQSIVVPPVHDTSPPPFDDDVDDNDFVPTMSNDEEETTDVLNNSNDDWKSVDDNNDTDIAQVEDNDQIETIVQNQEDAIVVVVVEEKKNNNDNNWANFASFGNETDEVLETPSANEENNDDNWADFESSPVPFSQTINENVELEPIKSQEEEENNNEDDDDFGDFGEIQTIPPSQTSSLPTVQTVNETVESESTKSQEVENINNDDDDDDDFGEFSEVQTASTSTPPLPPSQTSSLPTNTLSSEQIESLISTCFPIESTSASDDAFIATELASFTTYKHPAKQISYLESSLSLWKMLSNLSNDPVGIQFQWRKSNTEKLFHQALGVNERFRPKNVPLTPEVIQPEKVKSLNSSANEQENLTNETKTSSETIRPHFDWKKSGLQNPLADNDSSSVSSNLSKNEEIGFDANKTLDLDFYVPTTKSSNESEQITNSSVIQTNESPIIPAQRSSIPIKTSELTPNSMTTLTDDAKRIIENLPNFSFMSAKALMFPVRFNANNNEESTSLY